MINFNVEIGKFKLEDIRKKKSWLKSLVNAEGFNLIELNYIFMTDEALLAINKEYLKHDNYTDIITFDNSELEEVIEGDIFISVERLKENAKEFKVEFENELIRVMAHGLLHLCGYKDKSEADKKIMRSKENFYIEAYGKL